jgi:16S rRNA (cytidine1402-2'-O)-methyltransferase
LRALRVLRQVDWVAAEDTRRAQILFQAHEIHRPLLAHHAHNEHREVPRLIQRLQAGETGALITDAGMPGICDPGFLLAREARKSSIPVVVLPGPSAVTTALVASGFPPEPFLFLGYLPSAPGRRRRLLEGLRSETRTVVLFETPHRLRRSLEDLREVMPQREAAVLRELTKLFEEVLRGTAAEILQALGEQVRGEIVMVLAPMKGGASENGESAS